MTQNPATPTLETSAELRDLLTAEERTAWHLCYGAENVPMFSPAEMAEALETIALLRAELRGVRAVP